MHYQTVRMQNVKSWCFADNYGSHVNIFELILTLNSIHSISNIYEAQKSISPHFKFAICIINCYKNKQNICWDIGLVIAILPENVLLFWSILLSTWRIWSVAKYSCTPRKAPVELWAWKALTTALVTLSLALWCGVDSTLTRCTCCWQCYTPVTLSGFGYRAYQGACIPWKILVHLNHTLELQDFKEMFLNILVRPGAPCNFFTQTTPLGVPRHSGGTPCSPGIHLITPE